MSTRHRLVLGVLAAALAFSSQPTAATSHSKQLRIGTAAVAELDGDRIAPLWDEPALIKFLEEGLAKADDPRVHATLDSAKIERDGERYYLVGRGKSAARRCVTPTIELAEEPASAAAAAIRFIKIETCVSDNCPGCLAERDEAGHIEYCYCMPAGDCTKVTILIPVPF